VQAEADGPAAEAAETAIPEAAVHTRTVGRIVALELAAVFLVECVAPYVGALLPHPVRYTVGHLVYSAVAFTGMTLLLWALLLRDPTWTPPLPRGWAWLWEIPLGFLLAWGLWALGSVVARGLDAVGIHHASSYAEQSLRAITLDPALRWVRPVEMFVAVALEEVTFRAYFMHRLGQLVGPGSWMVVWVPALLFAVKHGYTLHGTVGVLVDGAVFGYVYRRTQRLPRLVYAHWLHNATIMSFYR